jgi:polyhydroxybutyrate depolymerase
LGVRTSIPSLVVALVLGACQLSSSGQAVPTTRPGSAASAGCASPARLPPIVTVRVDGQDRQAIVRGNETIPWPQPLVLLFHGYGDTGIGMETETGFSGRGLDEGFIAVYPRAQGDPSRWEFATDADIDFVVALLEKLEGSLCIDVNRVFATGMSMGGGMANFVGCRLSDRIAAIAPVAGTYGPAYGEPCKPDRPIPVLAIHAKGDHVVPYDGGAVDKGRLGIPPVVSVEDWADGWARRDGCQDGPTEQPVNGAMRLTWTDCDTDVQLYRLEGGGHVWPGGPGDADKEVLASDLIWTFFSRLSLGAAQ